MMKSVETFTIEAVQCFLVIIFVRECNKQKAVMTVVNQLYAGALLYLYHIWKKGKTIRDSGFVIKGMIKKYNVLHFDIKADTFSLPFQGYYWS